MSGRPCVSTHSIRYRILKAPRSPSKPTNHRCFNPFDPIQDTESLPVLRSGHQPRLVSTHSIRYRILKGRGTCRPVTSSTGFNPFDPIQDTERFTMISPSSSRISFNPFDPIQDTERTLYQVCNINTRPVSTHSIRYRILKGSCVGSSPGHHRVSTHSIRYRILKGYVKYLSRIDWTLFQPIRSDTGY